MYRDKPKIDRASIERTTHEVASYVRALIERAEDIGINVEEWEEPQPLTPQQQIDVMADLLRKKNRGEL